MVRYVVDGRQSTDQAGSGIGWLSFQFRLGAEVTDTSATGFTLNRPQLPAIPGLPSTPDPAPDVYSGTNLTFTDVTLFGTTLATPSSGTITSVREAGTDFTTIATGLNIDAADFYRVSATSGNRDNVRLLEQVFSGSDEFLGGDLRDKFNGFAGDDDIDGRLGNDRLWGGKGHDTLTGGNGNDSLKGGSGNDFLRGGRGNDTLEGGKGDDRLHGSVGEDVFVFKGGRLGTDTIENLNIRQDQIQIQHRSVTDFSDLTLTQVGSDTHVEYANTTIILENADLAGLSSTLFIF